MVSSGRRWLSLSLFISLGSVLLLWMTPQRAAAQDGIQISEDMAILNFPDTIEFHLSGSSEAPIEDIALTYGTNARSCQSSGSRQTIRFDAAQEVDVAWEWELKRSGAIPPGAKIWWEWNLIDSEGNSQRTERQEMAIADDRHAWRSTGRDGVTVNWFSGSSAFGEETLTLALDSLARLAEEIGVVPSEEIQFWLYPTAEEVRDVIVVSSEWAGAVAFTDYNIMILSLAPGQNQWAAEVIPHELTHVVVSMISFNCRGGRLPVWLNEGLAVYGEGPVDSTALARLIDALDEERLPALVGLADGFSAYGSGASMAYAHSGETVRYLIEHFGPERMDALLATIGSGTTIDPAMEEVYGFDSRELDARWRRSLGYTPTPTAAVNAQDEARPTMVPTLALVGPPIMATATDTPAPPTATAQKIKPTTTTVAISPTSTAATAVAMAPTATNPSYESVTPADSTAVTTAEDPTGDGAPVYLIWLLAIGVGVLVVALMFVRHTRKGKE